MKNLLIACFIILVSANFAFGELAYTPLDKSVKESDFVVTGTLQSVSENEVGALKISKGFLVIEKVISGNVRTEKEARLKPGDLIEVHWRNSTRGGCRFEIDAYTNGIWLLQIDSDGATKPLFPGAMVAVSKLDDVERLLKKLNRKTESVKTVKLKVDSNRDVEGLAIRNPNNQNSAISFGVYSIERKPNFALIRALFVVLGSLSMYYFLYRSRFKIR